MTSAEAKTALVQVCADLQLPATVASGVVLAFDVELPWRAGDVGATFAAVDAGLRRLSEAVTRSVQ